MQVSATTFQGYFITYFNFQDIVLLKLYHTFFFSVSFLSIIHVIVQICCIKESSPFGKPRSIHLYIHPTFTLEQVQLTPPIPTQNDKPLANPASWLLVDPWLPFQRKEPVIGSLVSCNRCFFATFPCITMPGNHALLLHLGVIPQGKQSKYSHSWWVTHE